MTNVFLLLCFVILLAQGQYNYYQHQHTITRVSNSKSYVLFTDSQNCSFAIGYHLPLKKFFPHVPINLTQEIPIPHAVQYLQADVDYLALCSNKQCWLCNQTLCETMADVSKIYFTKSQVLALASNGSAILYKQRGSSVWSRVNAAQLVGNTNIRLLSTSEYSPFVYAIGDNFNLYNVTHMDQQASLLNTSVSSMSHNDINRMVLFQDGNVDYYSFRDKVDFPPEEVGLTYKMEQFSVCSGFVAFRTSSNRLFFLGKLSDAFTSIAIINNWQPNARFVFITTTTFACHDNTVVFPMNNSIVAYGNLFALEPNLLLQFILALCVMVSPIILMCLELVSACLCCIRGFEYKVTMCIGILVGPFFNIPGFASVIIFAAVGNSVIDPTSRVDLIPYIYTFLCALQVVVILAYMVFVFRSRKSYFRPRTALFLLAFTILCFTGNYGLVCFSVLNLINARYYTSTGFNFGALVLYIFMKIALYFMLYFLYRNVLLRKQREKDEMVLQLLDTKDESIYTMQDDTDMNANLTIISFKEMSQFEELGSGTQGIVMKARWRSDWVAVKLFRKRFAEDEDVMATFKHEANLLCTLRHKNIVNIYGIINEHPRMGIVMELCSSGRLSGMHYFCFNNL